MQQIPANALPEDRQNDYRNCFTPGKEGYVVVGADAVGQELTIIGTLSEDPVFLDALKTGKDLHSVCAELIYGDKWKNAADQNCKFYTLVNNEYVRGKCSCKGHKKLRNTVKSLNFGLAYGLSPKGLSADLDIPLQEAEELFNTYFTTFPAIKGLLDSFGNFGKLNGFIRTKAPWKRKRYFPYWRGADTAKNMLSQIERASKNMPIQGLGSEHIKITAIEMRRWINRENLRDSVQFFMQVHDQLDLICKKHLADLVAKQLVFVMEKAAEICLNNTLMKADVQITDVWQK